MEPATGMLLLGIDSGGTKRVVVVGDHTGQLLEHIRKPMENSGDWRADLACLIAVGRELVERWQERSGERLGRVGVSVPGPADTHRGVLLNPPNLPSWHSAPIGEALREAFGVEGRVENDANAASLAEFEFGAGRGTRDMV